MKNFRYYLAFALLLILALSVRVHAGQPGGTTTSGQYARACNVARYLGNSMQLHPHQMHQVYRLALQQFAKQDSLAQVVFGSPAQYAAVTANADAQFVQAVQRLASPAQNARYLLGRQRVTTTSSTLVSVLHK
ncbi:hypothetical protein [Solirubrum puertoriconensis]|uniref:DUF4168 domain-containing protein n=1 Tax=Solirubrum puertoriconensis TaxID=1751427 RepID=A0A9X0HNW2_SOLP1|nr:hypothetical protein [Solirubrum puertoriconensis]KUG09403.1 hypothetical protein ASU33_16880 [Solirubrum puertoriconensis]